MSTTETGMGGGRGGPSHRHPAAAQQRPLVTEDPEVIGAGLILLEGGFDYGRDVLFPASGLQGNLLRAPTLGVSFGISSIAELQIDGGLYNRLTVTHRGVGPAPLAEPAQFHRRHDPRRRRHRPGHQDPHRRRDARASGLRRAVRDEAAERGQRERPRSRHHRLSRAGARRQDRAVDPDRRQRRARHPRRPDPRRQPERRPRLRRLRRARGARRPRGRRRAQRPREHARRHAAGRHREPRDDARRRTPDARHGAPRRRASCSASPRATPASASPPARPTCSRGSRCRSQFRVSSS